MSRLLKPVISIMKDKLTLETGINWLYLFHSGIVTYFDRNVAHKKIMCCLQYPTACLDHQSEDNPLRISMCRLPGKGRGRRDRRASKIKEIEK